MSVNAIQTKHNLDFQAAEWKRDKRIMVFKVGTCHGQYYFSKKGIEIVSIKNDNPGNGHLDDVFEWFEYAARTQHKTLFIREFINYRFMNHCIHKRGFIRMDGTMDVYKNHYQDPF
jgi:hypothetical protein